MSGVLVGRWVETGGVGEERRGVILYGFAVETVAEALRDLDQRYVPVDGVTSLPDRVPVLRCRRGAEADAARAAAPGVAWFVVELYRAGDEVEPARDVRLWLNIAEVDPRSAARAIDRPDLVTWYEVIDPIRVATVDGGPASADYRNLTITVPDGNRMVAHAVQIGGTAPPCLPRDAEMVVPTDDLWVLSQAAGRGNAACRACTLRHHLTTGSRR